MKSIAVSVLLVSTLLGLLLFTPAAVIASETNWQIKITATDVNGMNSAGSLTIGVADGYTDGIDYAKGEYIAPGGPTPATPTVATVASEMDGGVRSVRDFRAPYNLAVENKLWTVLIYQQIMNGGDLGTIRVAISKVSNIDLPPVIYYSYGDYSGSFNTIYPIPPIEVPARPASNPVQLYLRVGAVPEPSSIFGLASGLGALGLLRFRLRARK